MHAENTLKMRRSIYKQLKAISAVLTADMHIYAIYAHLCTLKFRGRLGTQRSDSNGHMHLRGFNLQSSAWEPLMCHLF